MRSHPGRWSLAVLSVALAAVTTTLMARLPSPGPSQSGSATAATHAGIVADAARPPWYGMTLLHEHVAWQEYVPPARPPVVKAKAAILVDPDSGRILYERNAHAQLPPASTVKLLTALVALENFSPDRLVTVTKSALFQAWDESRMFLHAGQALTVSELLTGLLTVSANDAADVLAVDTVGMERFVGAMNAQAAALGLQDTRVTSPVGLDAPGMHSSAIDLATLATVDMRDFPLLRHIVALHAVDLPKTRTHPEFFLENINLLLRMYPAADGIKTGYTGEAGACEIGMAVRNGHRLISVILNGNLVYSQSRRLLDWGFTQYGLPTQLPTPSPSPSPRPAH